MDSLVTSTVLNNLFSMDVRESEYDWKPFRDGVDIHVIYGDTKQGPSAALLRYQRNAQVPLHFHLGYEHILILSGSQTDGQQVFERGTLLVSPPGSHHHVTSHEGCVVLAIWQEAVDFVSE